MLSVGHMNVKTPRTHVAVAGRRRFRHDRQITDELASTPEVAGDGQALELWRGRPEGIHSMIQEGGGAVQMQASFAALRDRQILQDLGLQRGALPLLFLIRSSLAA